MTGGMDDAELIEGLWREVRPAQLALLHRLVADVAAVGGPDRDGPDRDGPDRDGPDPDTWDRIREASHRLAGTLGSFGQQPAGQAAVALESLLADAERAADVPLDRLRALTVALHEALPHSATECSSR